MKYRSIRKLAGQHIHRVYVDLEDSPVEVKAPPKNRFLTFTVNGHLILDPYNDEMNLKVRKKLFGKKPQWAIAIDLRTGEIRTAHYLVDDDGKNALSLERTLQYGGLVEEQHLPASMQHGCYAVPMDYLPKLPQLLEKKRPYKIELTRWGAEEFICRNTGWPELKTDLVISLRFDDHTLEIFETEQRVCRLHEPGPRNT